MCNIYKGIYNIDDEPPKVGVVNAIIINIYMWVYYYSCETPLYT
jgi:hypothetical protein